MVYTMKQKNAPSISKPDSAKPPAKPPVKPDLTGEIGGYNGQEPTEHGDWQHKGRTTDF